MIAISKKIGVSTVMLFTPNMYSSAYAASGIIKPVKRYFHYIEFQILAARARARFVRFSKPILNENLRKARKKAARWNFLSSFAW